jgi:hypothetical protein
MRNAVVLTGLCLCLLASAPPAVASPGIRFGIQDDAWLAHGPGTLEDRLDELERLGVDLVRYNLRWDVVEVDRGSPSWDEADALLEGLRARGIAAVVAIVGTPSWANGGRPGYYVPRRAADFAAFAREAATRYRWIRDWLIWNEPNQVRWLRPTTPTVYVTRLLNPAYAAIHAVNPGARVAGGVTAPRANRGGVSPVDWIRGMRAARARLDVYAHHPYPARPSDSPFAGGCARADCETISMARLERLLQEVARAWGKGKRIWLTEYGYQTNPPDRIAGVSETRHAQLLGEAALRAHKAPRVDMLVHYLVRDEPERALHDSRPREAQRAGVPAPARAGRSHRRDGAALGHGAPALGGSALPPPGAHRRRPLALAGRHPPDDGARLPHRPRDGAAGRRGPPLVAARPRVRHPRLGSLTGARPQSRYVGGRARASRHPRWSRCPPGDADPGAVSLLLRHRRLSRG